LEFNHMPKEVFLGLGSNQGDSVSILRLAAWELSEISECEILGSSIWKTTPEGFSEPVPDFFNAVVRIITDMTPEKLLDFVLSIETQLGRSSSQKFCHYRSRLIDIDIIDFGGLISDSDQLTLPHPRAHLRQFVLRPLLEISPDFKFPNMRESLEYLLDLAEDNRMSRISPLILSE